MKKRDTKGAEQHISQVPKEHRMNKNQRNTLQMKDKRCIFKNLLYPFPLVFKTELIIHVHRPMNPFTKIVNFISLLLLKLNQNDQHIQKDHKAYRIEDEAVYQG